MARKTEEVSTVRRRVQVTAILAAAESAESPPSPPASNAPHVQPAASPAPTTPAARGRGTAVGPVAGATGSPGAGTVAIRPRRGDPSAPAAPGDPPPSVRARTPSSPRGEDPRTVTAKLQRNLEAKRESIDRIALFTATFMAGRASELLGGLVPSAAAAAQALAEQVSGLDSMMRKARAARAFGERVDAPQRVKGLFHEAHGLAGELVTKLPPYLVAGTHRVAAAERGLTCPARTALLDRLIREATR